MYFPSPARQPKFASINANSRERGTRPKKNALLGKNVPRGLGASFIAAVNSRLRKMLKEKKRKIRGGINFALRCPR